LIHRRDLLKWTPSLALGPVLAQAQAQAQAQGPSASQTPGVGAPPLNLPAPRSVPELPIDNFFAKPSYGSLVMSPSQRYLAAVAPANNRFQLVVIDTEQRSGNRVTNLQRSDVSSVLWANDNQLIFTTGDQQGFDFRSDGGLFIVDRDGKNGRTLVEPLFNSGSYVPRITRPLGRIPGTTDEILVEANDRSADSVDIYRLNLTTGRKTLVNMNSPGNVLQWFRDKDRNPRAALCADIRRKRYWFAYQSPGSKEWKTLSQWDENLQDVIVPIAFDPANPAQMYVGSNVGRDTLALYRFDPEAGKLGELVLADPRYDLASFALIGAGGGAGLIFGGSEDEPGKLLGVSYMAEKPRMVWFDEEAAKTQAMVDNALRDTINTFNVNAKRTLVLARSDTKPGEYYFFDKEKRQLTATGISVRPEVDPKTRCPMLPVSWTARDGLRIDGYLTLPPNFTKGQPVPLILHPHGGPWARDMWRYNPEVQFMANRGFAVLQPNFRGSVGYGAKHLKLSYKQWGATMIDDMLDGVQWAIDQGFADPQRLGVYGASYGGYATLMAMIKRPDWFKWGINYVGVTDMTVHQDTQPAQKGDFYELAKALNGDQKADADVFETQSPARQVAKIAAPVFHAYGGEDRNVDYSNGRTIRSAFEKAGKPYEWMYVLEEAHGYRVQKNVLEFYSRFDAFIKKHTPGLGKA